MNELTPTYKCLVVSAFLSWGKRKYFNIIKCQKDL